MVNIVAVLLGGLVGTGLRLGADAVLSHSATGFPWSTLLVNVVGSFALGLAAARVWPVAPEWLRLGLGTGILGSFTTFSAVVASSSELLATGQPLVAVGNVVMTLVVGIGAALLGIRVGHRRVPEIGAEE